MTLVNHSVLGATILAVADGMAAATTGARADELLGSHGLDREQLGVPMARAPYEESVAFMRAVNVALSDPIFHMRVSAQAPLGTYHIADYFTMCAPTVGVGFGTTLRNAYLINSAICCEIEETPEAFIVSMRSVEGGPCLAIESETLFAAFALRMHWIAAANTPRTTLRFREPPPGDLAEIEALFMCHVEVVPAASCDQFIVPRATWESPSSYANPTMHAIINKLLIPNSRRHHMVRGMLMRVESAVVKTLGSGAAIEEVASLLYMSSRTLQRRLTELGVKFRQVVTVTRHRLAMEMLGDQRINLLEVASRAGYNDVSAFGRAFRKLTGYTPSDFRELHERDQRLIAQTLLLDPHPEESSLEELSG